MTKVLADREAARQAETDPAAILAAAIAKAKESEVGAAASPAVLDLAKTAAALRLMIKASEGKLTKGLWSVARLCEIIEALTWLQQDTTWEQAGENDKSAVPANIAEHVAGLLGCLNQMVAEESAEIVTAYNDQGMDIDLDVDGGDVAVIAAAVSILDLAKADIVLMEKVGARHSKADAANIQDAHDALAKLGAMCDPQNCPDDSADKRTGAGDLAKLATEAAETLAKQSDEIADLRKNAAEEPARTAAAIDAALAKFRKEPLPPRTAASNHASVGKADDATPGATDQPSADDVQKALDALPADDRAMLLMKVALSNGRPIVTR